MQPRALIHSGFPHVQSLAELAGKIAIRDQRGHARKTNLATVCVPSENQFGSQVSHRIEDARVGRMSDTDTNGIGAEPTLREAVD